jgi:hypothetical protein
MGVCEKVRKRTRAGNQGLAMSKYPVYGTQDNRFFSEFVTRAFGVNCDVVMTNGTVAFSVVWPANEHVKQDLPIVGHIEIVD